MFKWLGIVFILKLYAQIEIFTKIICIWKRRICILYLYFEEAHLNAYI